MHASIWKFSGDPAELIPRYDAMIGEIPRGNMRLHLCLKGDDGIVLVDTCPDRAAFERFVAGPEFRSLRRAHGLPVRRCLAAPARPKAAPKPKAEAKTEVKKTAVRTKSTPAAVKKTGTTRNTKKADS